MVKLDTPPENPRRMGMGWNDKMDLLEGGLDVSGRVGRKQGLSGVELWHRRSVAEPRPRSR